MGYLVGISNPYISESMGYFIYITVKGQRNNNNNTSSLVPLLPQSDLDTFNSTVTHWAEWNINTSYQILGEITSGDS